MRNVSDENCREIKTLFFLFSTFLSEDSAVLSDNLEKYCKAGQSIDDNMAHAYCMLDT